jgi:hypothetical protein
MTTSNGHPISTILTDATPISAPLAYPFARVACRGRLCLGDRGAGCALAWSIVAPSRGGRISPRPVLPPPAPDLVAAGWDAGTGAMDGVLSLTQVGDVIAVSLRVGASGGGSRLLGSSTEERGCRLAPTASAAAVVVQPSSPVCQMVPRRPGFPANCLQEAAGRRTRADGVARSPGLHRSHLAARPPRLHRARRRAPLRDTGQGRRALAAHTPQVPRGYPRSAAAFQSLGMFPGQRGSAASSQPRRGARRGQGSVSQPSPHAVDRLAAAAVVAAGVFAALPPRAVAPLPGANCPAVARSLRQVTQDAVARSLAQVVADLAARQPPLCCCPVAASSRAGCVTLRLAAVPEHEPRRVRPGRPRPSRPCASEKFRWWPGARPCPGCICWPCASQQPLRLCDVPFQFDRYSLRGPR